MSMIIRFIRGEDGATAIEYALIALLIGVGIIASLQLVAPAINSNFVTVGNSL